MSSISSFFDRLPLNNVVVVGLAVGLVVAVIMGAVSPHPVGPQPENQPEALIDADATADVVSAVAVSAFEADPVRNTALFRVNHLDQTLLTGRFTDVSGFFHLNLRSDELDAVSFSVATESLILDSPPDGTMWDVPNIDRNAGFPVMTFTSTRVTEEREGTYTASGLLSTPGVERPLLLSATRSGTRVTPLGSFATLSLAGRIYRADFGRFGELQIPNAADMSDTVDIIIELEGALPASQKSQTVAGASFRSLFA